MFNVKFIDTGFITQSLKSNIEKGTVKDLIASRVYGFGSSYGVDLQKYNKEHRLWMHMLERCYSKQDSKYKSYKDVTICERWLSFCNFLEDIVDVKNYKEWKENGNMHLDKDKNSNEFKIYSLETCEFITPRENSKLVNTLIIHDKEKKTFLFRKIGIKEWSEHFGIKDFCRKYGTYSSGINNCFKGIQKQHKGFEFKEI